MSGLTLRGRLKSGFWGRPYAFLKVTKRRLRRQPLAGDIPVVYRPMPAAELRAAVSAMPDHGRVYYSLALCYMDLALAEYDRRALACLRGAGALGFESPERVSLSMALLALRRGDVRETTRLLHGLQPYDLTSAENTLRESLLQGGRLDPAGASGALTLPDAPDAPGDQWRGVRPAVERACAGAEGARLLVIGDVHAATSAWCPGADYLLVSPDVTGLDIATAAGLGLHFTAGVGAADDVRRAAAAGMRCEQWFPLPGATRPLTAAT